MHFLTEKEIKIVVGGSIVMNALQFARDHKLLMFNCTVGLILNIYFTYQKKLQEQYLQQLL